MKHPLLPQGYGILQLADERFYPIRADVEPDQDKPTFLCTSPLYWDFDRYHEIPPAIGPWQTEGLISFATKKEAVAYCKRCSERYGVCWDLPREATARSHVYPERTAWYLDEIEALTGERPWLEVTKWDAAWRLKVWKPEPRYFWEFASNIDDALMALYERVCSTYGQAENAPVLPLAQGV
jgi:hypothetical protein